MTEYMICRNCRGEGIVFGIKVIYDIHTK